MTKTANGDAGAKPVAAWLGLGIMGQAMAANLLREGTFSQLLVWNRSAAKTADLVKAGAVAVATPAEAVAKADIVFGMLADPAAALEVCCGVGVGGGRGVVERARRGHGTRRQRPVLQRIDMPHRPTPPPFQVALGENGVASAMAPGKAYVDMSTVDEDTSKRIAEAGEAWALRGRQRPGLGRALPRAAAGRPPAGRRPMLDAAPCWTPCVSGLPTEGPPLPPPQ
jgi:hypothetical protein